MADLTQTASTGENDETAGALVITPITQLVALVAQSLPDAQQISVTAIDIHAPTSSRLAPNHSVAKFTDLLNEGKELPAIVLFYDETTHRYYVGDGWERVEAALDLKAQMVGAHVLPGNAELAYLFHVWKNSDQGMPLSDMEVHHAIEHLLCNYPWETDTTIADMCHVTRGMVQRLRYKLIEQGKMERTSTRRDRHGREFAVVPPRSQTNGQPGAVGDRSDVPVPAQPPAQRVDPITYIQAHASTRLLKLYQTQLVSLEAIEAVVRALESGVIALDDAPVPLNPRVKAVVEKHGLADAEIIPVLQHLAEATPPDERFRSIERTGSMPGKNGGSVPLWKCTLDDFTSTSGDAASNPPLAASTPTPSKAAVGGPTPVPAEDESGSEEPPVAPPAPAPIQVEDAPAVRTFPGDVLTRLEANSVRLILDLGGLDAIDWALLGQQADEVLQPGGFLAVEIQQNQLSRVLPVLDQSLSFWRVVMARGESRKIPGRCQIMGCVRMVAIYTRLDDEGNLVPNPDWLSEFFDAASDEEIAAKLISALTLPGATVANPFGVIGGSVQTTSARWGRPWVGLASEADQ